MRRLEARASSPRLNRAHLIAAGAIRPVDPDELSRTPPLDHRRVLRIDDAGREAARRAIAKPDRHWELADPVLDAAIEQRSRTRRARP
ncbi:MAG: hypothetical protein L6Q84_24415 [Polyangiaceae bacterium]|nr:hypothetical protein [Polyangiaceae bacterium]